MKVSRSCSGICSQKGKFSLNNSISSCFSITDSEKIYGLIIARIREKVNKAGEFLKILKKLFSKSFFSGVRGKALRLALRADCVPQDVRKE